MATEYATLTFKADTSEMERAEDRLDAVATSGVRAQKAVDKAGTSAKNAGKNIGGMGRNAGQAGIQIQQFVGQVQGGQNPLVAFSQQASDLGIVLGFPLLGAVAGITAAFATPLISALFGGTDAMDEMRKTAEDLAESVDDLSESQRAYFALLEERGLEVLQDQLRDTQSQLEDHLRTLNEISQAYIAMESFSEISAEQEAKHAEETLRLQTIIDTLNQQIEERNERISRYRGELQELSPEEEAALERAERFVEKLQEQADTLGLSRKEAIMYQAAQMDLTDEQMRAVEVHSQRIQQYYDEQEAAKALEAEKRRIAKEEEERERFISNLRKRAVAETVRLEREAEQQREAERRAQEQREREANQRQVEDARYVNEAMLNFEDVLLKGKSEKQKAGYRLAVNLMNAEKRERAASIVSASYDAAMKAWSALAGIPIIGPALGAAAAGTILAAGVTYAAQSLAGRALGGQVRAGESYVVGERGPEVLTMGSSGRIIPNEAMRGGQEQAVNRTTNVTFQISTVDARGFDQLLQSRRGQIISMINSASNDKGRPAVV